MIPVERLPLVLEEGCLFKAALPDGPVIVELAGPR
jgi:hypothetical protein